jgi:hypothetical protein
VEENMNKILVGLIVGAVLGLIDGATAWFTPQVRDQMLGIIIGSTFKGVIAGIAAGWFARKVQSVPKGIAFGFVVGLVLAFAVAAMPDPKTGEHYWWQIMVPGSLLGGVIGWATQRYGRPAGSNRSAAAAAMFIVALFGVNAYAGHEGHAVKKVAPPAFEKLKSLAGTWDATMLKPDGEKTTVEYRVTADGSVVMEMMFVGTPHEMINMYTVDGDALLATHYCSAGNQPTLRFNAVKSNTDQLVFDFVKVTGKDTPYINGVRIRFDGPKVVEEWSSSAGRDQMTLYLHVKR